MSRFFKLLGAVTVINIIARLLGFGREVIIGYQYGTSYQADSIITAFTIPNFIYVVIGGAVTTAFISVYSKLDKSKANHFSQSVLTGLAVIVGFITLLFVIFPAFWMELFFSGMSPEAMELTSKLFMWMAPSTFFLVLAMLFSGLHNIHENYRLSSFSTLLFNALFLVIGAGLTPFLFEYSYGLGALIGSLFMMVFLALFIQRQKLMPLRLKFVWQPEIKRFIHLALPIIFGGATLQFYLIIQRIYASGLENGAIAALNYASKMTQFPQAVLMTSVTTIIYPLLAKAVGEKNDKKVSDAYRQGFRLLSLILLPATIFVVFYAKDIITFIFEYGSFDAQSTNNTYPLLQILALSMFSLALNTYITRFFYAKEDSYMPIVINIVSIFGVNIFVISLLIESMGAAAIAYGTVIGTFVNMVLLIIAAKLKFQLKISSFRLFMKLVVFVVIASGAIWLSTLIPAGTPFVALLVGGLATLVVVFAGIKTVK